MEDRLTTLGRKSVVALAVALVIAACSEGATTTTTTTTTAAPTTAPPVSTTSTPSPSTTTTTTVAPVVITIWADERTAGALDAIGGDYSTRRGVAIEVIELPFPSIRSDILSAATSGDLPDLFVGAHTWTGALRDAGAITPVRGLPRTQTQGFIAPALEAFRLDGELYGIPYAAESIALWTNTDLAGTTPPVSFGALLDLCDTLSLDVVCLAVAGGAGIPEAYYQYPFVTGFGGSILRYEEGTGYIADRAGIDEPESIAASVFLAALDRGDYLPSLDYVTAKQRFVEGEVAFWLTGHWEAEAIEVAAENRGFSTAVIPVPPIEGVPAQPFVDALGIFLGADASTEAKIFLTDWLATGEAMVGLAPAPPLFPAHDVAAARVTDDQRKPFLAAIRTGVPTPNLVEMTDEIWDAWGSALTAIRDERADPEATLVDAARRIRNILGIPQHAEEVDDG